jgi:hypothetical protein
MAQTLGRVIIFFRGNGLDTSAAREDKNYYYNSIMSLYLHEYFHVLEFEYKALEKNEPSICLETNENMADKYGSYYKDVEKRRELARDYFGRDLK